MIEHKIIRCDYSTLRYELARAGREDFYVVHVHVEPAVASDPAFPRKRSYEIIMEREVTYLTEAYLDGDKSCPDDHEATPAKPQSLWKRFEEWLNRR